MFSVANPTAVAAPDQLSSFVPGPMDLNMRYLNVELMQRYRTMFNTDVIHRVADILTDKVLGNGLRMHRIGMNPSDDLRTAYEMAWSRFVQRVMESWWCFGFAAVTSEQNDAIGSVPIVLNPELMRIGFHEDYRGRRTWVFYELDVLSGLYGTGGRVLYEPIPNVQVFEFSSPSVDGTINSCISRIMPIFNQMIIATEAALRAATSNSAPAMWVQMRVQDKPVGADLAGRGTASVRASAVLPQSTTTTSSSSIGSVTNTGSYGVDETSVNRDATVQLRVLGSFSAVSSGPGSDASIPNRMQQFNQAVRVMRLPNGLEGTAFSAAPEPKYLPHYVEKFEQSVANAFKVPITAFSADKFLRGDRSSHRQYSEADTAALEQSARMMQIALLQVMNELAECMYGDEFREDALLLSVSDPSFTTLATAKPQVRWEFPVPVGVDTMRKLWLEGSLKREPYIACASETHRLDMNMFEATPAMSIQELQGIDTTADDSKRKPAKKRKNE